MNLACQPQAARAPSVEHSGETKAASEPASPSEPDLAGGNEAPWWDQPYPERFQSELKYTLPFVRVEGNGFVDESGNPIVFQGVNIADPDKLRREGHFDRGLFEAIQSWGANVVRVPVHPAAWRGVGRAEYFELLDQAVTWATELELYLIIDWHSIGNLVTELYQHPMYDTTRKETFEFWRSVAHRYNDVPTIAFYELFNEPTRYNENLGRVSWEQWKTLNEEIITIIQSHDRKVIPLVAGFNWAFDLRPVRDAPIEKQGIAYVSHPYPQKVERPYEEKWDEIFGFVAEKYPLVTTEIGYMPADAPGAHVPVKDDGSYGKLITDYLAKRGASWTAWCFHPDWAPPLIQDWSYEPTEAGEHFRSVMLKRHENEEARSVATH